MSSERRLGAALVGIAVLAVAAAQMMSPFAQPPLYDGPLPSPYVWLDAPAGQPSGAQSATMSFEPTKDHSNPLIVLSTPEYTPQAQFFALAGSFTVPAGTTSILATITPVEPEAPPPAGYIDGNVYEMSVNDQAGAPLTFATGATPITVAMRGINDPSVTGITDEMWLYEPGSGWLDAQSKYAGTAATYLANMTNLGVFALVAPGQDPNATPTPPATPTQPGATPTQPGATVTPSPGASATSSATSTPLASGTPIASATPTPIVPPPGPGSGGGGVPILSIAVLALVAAAIVGIGLFAYRRANRPPAPPSRPVQRRPKPRRR